MSRRSLVQGLLAGTAGVAAVPALLRRPEAEAAPSDGATKFLIVLGGFGGASVNDSFLAVSETDPGFSGAEARVVNAYPNSELVTFPDSPFTAVDRVNNLFGGDYVSQQSAFVNAHKDHMLVATQTVTSVNHTVGQKRAITGNGAWDGRTLQEIVAAEYGMGRALPNVNMGSLGFRSDGDDPAVPAAARAEPVAAPLRWPLSLDGVKGIEDHPDEEIVELARTVRNEQLDPQSTFWQTFRLSDKLKRWKKQRNEQQPALEQAELLRKLNFGVEYEGLPPFDQNDLTALESVFGYLTMDPLESQAAMAYLLIKHGLSVSVTISPNWSIVTNPLSDTPGEPLLFNPPLSFDYSHTGHRVCQGIMWQRMLDVIDSLVQLLSSTPHPEVGSDSLFDHTVIYLATDFGRDKNRASGSLTFGSGHNLNNGNLIVSPCIRSNTVLGGVHRPSLDTFGYNAIDGSDDPNAEMGESYIFAGVLAALGVDTSGSSLPAVPAFLP